uniref:Uncharacterized protein n=1 Tax=Mus musculus TaxID=10090 RepID=Q8CET1_MOUSE|nr:unnamed protein product [Mus musculus]
MCHTSGTCMPTGLCSSSLSPPPPSIALSTTMTISALQRTQPARSGALTFASKQFSGNPTPSGWRIKGQCVATWLSLSASSPLQCRNTLASCLGRKTRSPSLQPWGFRHIVCCLSSMDPLASILQGLRI